MLKALPYIFFVWNGIERIDLHRVGEGFWDQTLVHRIGWVSNRERRLTASLSSAQSCSCQEGCRGALPPSCWSPPRDTVVEGTYEAVRQK